MAAVNKIDSNVTGLRIAEEVSYGVLPSSPVPVWKPLEPNSYDEFGGSISTVARNPINPSRQRSKGVTTDLDASGGFQVDFTQEGQQEVLQGLMFADLRKKAELNVATVDGTANEYEPASGGAAYEAGDLLFAKFFDDSVNNGLKVVTGTPTGTAIAVTDTGLISAAGQSGIISRVGFQFAAGDAEISVSGDYPSLITSAKDLTDFGLVPGEWVFVGGDAAGNRYNTTANNGFKRVRSITSNEMTFDKSEAAMSGELDGSNLKTIRIFFGRVLKNELGELIKTRSYNVERTLGAPDDANPSQIQSEYLVGAVFNEGTLTINTADKMTMDLSVVAKNHETRTGVEGVKSGTRPAGRDSDAFNTSSDIKRTKMSIVTPGSEAPTPLFAFITDLSISINNNVTPNKAVGVLGGFSVTAGTFEVSGSVTAYFSDVTAVQAVRDNEDVTLDLVVVKNNAGFIIDLPLIALGESRVTVEQDEPITLPINMDAARAAKVDPDMDYTLLWAFFDYLPDLAN